MPYLNFPDGTQKYIENTEPETIAKAKALKNRKGATAHDKAQANWFINMQKGKK